MYSCVYNQGFTESRIQTKSSEQECTELIRFILFKLCVCETQALIQSLGAIITSFTSVFQKHPSVSVSTHRQLHTCKHTYLHTYCILYSTYTVTHRQPCLTYDTEGLPGKAQSPLPSSVATAASSRPDANDVLQTKHNDHYKLLQVATQQHIISLITLYSNTLGCIRKQCTSGFILVSHVTMYFVVIIN